jgi:hypothetical protein
MKYRHKCVWAGLIAWFAFSGDALLLARPQSVVSGSELSTAQAHATPRPTPATGLLRSEDGTQGPGDRVANSPWPGDGAAAATLQDRPALPPPARIKSERLRGGPSVQVQSRVVRVGPTRRYGKPSEAAAVANDHDIIEIDAAEYRGDVAIWRQNGLTLRGVGGRPHLRADGRNADGKGIWVIKGDDTVVENVEFSGARVPDLNGAGIRHEGKNLTVRNSFFHDNEMGILTNNDISPNEIVIEFSEFYANTVDYQKHGRLGHNIYIGRTDRFVLRGSYVHGAVTGHNVKSRALENIIVNNRITDESDGASSHLIDLSEGGSAYVVGNIFHQSTASENYHMLAYAADGNKGNPGDAYFASNTFVNDKENGYFIINFSDEAIKIFNNFAAGGGDYVSGAGIVKGNIWATQPHFANQETFDYRLTARSPAIDRGVEVDPESGRAIVPSHVYVHPMQVAPRPKAGPLDVGAYEFAGDDPDPMPLCQDSSLYPLNLLFASCS